MGHVDHVSYSFFAYLGEIVFPVLIGFIFSGIIHEFVSERFVQKHLGNDSVGAVFTATWIGALLPVCCVGSLPIAVTLRQKGARLGPMLAFLVTTPATSAPAIFLSIKLMGLTFTAFMVTTVVLLGLVIGFFGNFLEISNPQKNKAASDCCCGEHSSGDLNKTIVLKRIVNVLKYAFVVLPRKIGLEIVIGALVASIIVSFESLRGFLRAQLSGFKGYLILVVIGLIDYVCSTASVPVADALTRSGVSLGKSMVYLLMGPITSYATILVIRKEFGTKVLMVYLVVIAIGSVYAGWLYDLLFAQTLWDNS